MLYLIWRFCFNKNDFSVSPLRHLLHHRTVLSYGHKFDELWSGDSVILLVCNCAIVACISQSGEWNMYQCMTFEIYQIRAQLPIECTSRCRELRLRIKRKITIWWFFCSVRQVQHSLIHQNNFVYTDKYDGASIQENDTTTHGERERQKRTKKTPPFTKEMVNVIELLRRPNSQQATRKCTSLAKQNGEKRLRIWWSLIMWLAFFPHLFVDGFLCLNFSNTVWANGLLGLCEPPVSSVINDVDYWLLALLPYEQN